MVGRKKGKTWEVLVFLQLRKLRLRGRVACDYTAGGLRVEAVLPFLSLGIHPRAVCLQGWGCHFSHGLSPFSSLSMCCAPTGAKPCHRPFRGNKGSEAGGMRKGLGGAGTGLRLDGGQQPANMAALRGEQPTLLGVWGRQAWHRGGACHTCWSTDTHVA